MEWARPCTCPAARWARAGLARSRAREPHGHDLVLGLECGRPRGQRVAALAQGEVAPREFLDGPDARVLLFPLGVGLGGEGDPGGKIAPFHFLAVQVEMDARDHEAEAAIDLSVRLPYEVGDLVVAPRACRHELRHRWPPLVHSERSIDIAT